MDPEELRHGDDVGLVEPPGHQRQQKGAEKPGRHGVDQHGDAVLVHAAGEAEDGDGRHPGAGEGADAQGQAHRPAADEIVPHGAPRAETVFADDHQYQGVNTEIEEVKSGLTHHFQSSLWLFR